jgi:GPH family glycoside/pentoside/hexuronide:cation symporter
MVSKIGDAINDPIIGVMSDRTRSRWGRRYSWMLWGAIPFGILFFLQWLVPPGNTWLLYGYYVVLGLLFNTAYTAVNLPYTALTAELTDDYDERTSLNSFRFAFSIGGSLLSLILGKIVADQIPDPVWQYIWLAAICTLLSVLPILWCVVGTFRYGMAAERRCAERNETAPSLGLKQQLAIVFQNRPFLYVIGIYLCSWLAVQLTASILPYFVVSYMGLQQADFFMVAIGVQLTAFAMLFVWSALSRRWGKRGVYFAGMSLWIIAQAGLLLLQPGQTGLLYLLAVMAGVGVSTAYLVPWSMLPDVIELDELTTGQRREGVFYAFMVFLQKLGLALALWLVGIALEVAGYLPTAAGGTPANQPASALLAIRLAIGPLPTAALIGGLVLAYFYPITRDIHAEILLKLAERKRANQQASQD